MIDKRSQWITVKEMGLNMQHFYLADTTTLDAVVPRWLLLAVREITKSSSTFSATNISSNIVWLLQLHDTIQMESNFCYQIQ